MNAWIALGAGILGSLIGTVFNYLEEYFRSHGEISTFVGRLIPVSRQYISLPAGLARMRIDLFALYAALGAGIWCAILTWIGWCLGTQAERLGGLPPEQVHRYPNTAPLILAPAVAPLVVIYVVCHRRRRRAAT